jgi:hypothetical protein
MTGHQLQCASTNLPRPTRMRGHSRLGWRTYQSVQACTESWPLGDLRLLNLACNVIREVYCHMSSPATNRLSSNRKSRTWRWSSCSYRYLFHDDGRSSFSRSLRGLALFVGIFWIIKPFYPIDGLSAGRGLRWVTLTDI